MQNLKAIQKHYDKFTAPERFALMVAAGLRGDKADREALADSAPKITLEFPHTMGLQEGFIFLMTWHLIEQLGTMASFYFTMFQDDDDAILPDGHSMGNAIELAQQRFLERAEAWRVICKEYGVDALALTDIYGYGPILETTELIIHAANRDNPIELTDLQAMIDAYRAGIENERKHWYEGQARA